jgi:hypothetical protein
MSFLTRLGAIITSKTGGLLVVSGSLSIIAALCFIAVQGINWLKFGHWPHLPLSWAFQELDISYPTTSWRGIQEIIDWCMDCPFSGCLFFMGLALSLIGIKILDREQK